MSPKPPSLRRDVESILREGESIHRPADRSDVDVKLLEYDARNLSDTIRNELPKGVGFTLFLFDYGGKGRLTYLSTAKRDDMLRTIAAWLVIELEKEAP
jgi:hypothetical protein